MRGGSPRASGTRSFQEGVRDLQRRNAGPVAKSAPTKGDGKAEPAKPRLRLEPTDVGLVDDRRLAEVTWGCGEAAPEPVGRGVFNNRPGMLKNRHPAKC